MMIAQAHTTFNKDGILFFFFYYFIKISLSTICGALKFRFHNSEIFLSKQLS